MAQNIKNSHGEGQIHENVASPIYKNPVKANLINDLVQLLMLKASSHQRYKEEDKKLMENLEINKKEFTKLESLPVNESGSSLAEDVSKDDDLVQLLMLKASSHQRYKEEDKKLMEKLEIIKKEFTKVESLPINESGCSLAEDVSKDGEGQIHENVASPISKNPSKANLNNFLVQCFLSKISSLKRNREEDEKLKKELKLAEEKNATSTQVKEMKKMKLDT